MVAAAKRGLELSKSSSVSNNDVPEISLKSGRKIASGQQISDDHVRSMSAYHGSHFPQFSGSTLMSGGCPSGGDAEHADDLLWGGPAGASWAASRVAAMDATELAESESPDIDVLLSGDDGFSMEIFSRADLMDRFEMTKDAEGLIWAPIIRSGTLAMRPGPNGTKEHKPLVFVSGHATDHVKEIGLADLVDAFNDRAVEHVTIPKTHANDTLENTGTIVKMRIDDSTLRPGEKVIVAGHKFTDADVEKKVLEGSVLSRSCGILHAYTNTETGKTYPHVVEHTALTNRPWVTGMEPYGSNCFSDRPVVPMLLSEEIVVEPPKGPSSKPIFSTSTPQEDLERELKLADVQWGDELSLVQVQRQLYQTLREMGRSPDYDESSIYFDVMDITPTKALVRVDYGGNDDPDDAWVIPYALDDTGKLTLADFSEWKPVEQQWVTDEDADQDKQEVQAILQESTSMSDPIAYLESNILLSEDDLNLATLTSKARKSLPEGAFVFPPKDGKPGRYPIADLAHARNALARSSGKPEESAVKSAVYKKYPQLKSGSGSGSKSDMSDPIKRAAQLRLSQEPRANQQPGGIMGLTPELLGKLDLSDEAREVLQREIDAENSDKQELAELRKQRREDGVKDRLTKLSEMDIFKGKQGFLRYVERTLMSDDGQAAIRLDLADGSAPAVKTVTQVLDEMIATLAGSEDPSKTQLSQTGSLLDNPLERRPDLEPEPLGAKDKVKTGDELLAEWQKAAGGQLDLAIAPAGGKE